MSEASACETARRAIRSESVSTAAQSAADALRFAAAPTFAVMALLTGGGGGAPNWVCSAAHDASPLSGMALMYWLMCVIHSPTWLKALSSRRPGRECPDPPHDPDRG